MITGIAHNAIKVTDMEAALRFYCDVAGFKKVFELPDRQTGKPWIVYLKICKGQFLELFYGGVKDRERAYDRGYIGYQHWCVIVEADSMPELAKRFYEKGLMDEPVVRTGSDKNYSLWIHDPDGNALEFGAYNPDSPQMKSNKFPYPYGREGFSGIGHVGFFAEDMERSLDFYRNVLGLEHIHTDLREGAPWLEYLRVCDGSYIQLFHGGTKRFQVTPASAGHDHVCLECDDTASTVAGIRDKGAPIDVEPMRGSDGNTQAWTHDPDGNRIELMTIHPASRQANA